MGIDTVTYFRGAVKLIDQTLLPHKLKYIYCRDIKTLWAAIKRLSVRGAPAIGVAAGFGVVLGCNSFKGKDKKKFVKHINKVCDYLATSRPTAVNLFNALDQMRAVLSNFPDQRVSDLKELLKQEAFMIYNLDRQTCRTMGDYGEKLIKQNATIMTICNAGALATADYGTALGVMYSAQKKKKKFKVYALETRPLLQGARLTAWELTRAKIDTTLICDNMAASVMKNKGVDAIFTGADCVASNGDAANKIGTYNLAILAKYHKVPFYIVAPFSTFNMNIKSGLEIPIEERSKYEVLGFGSIKTAPENVKIFNPAFDVTDYKLITAIVTEAGVIFPPFKNNIQKAFIKYERSRSR
jgi:methylthioribose-1-phosphate isomerase